MNKEILFKYRRPLFIGIAFVILIIILFSSSENNSLQPTWTSVQRGPFTVHVSETGEVRAVQQVDVKAPMEWRMELQIVDLAPEGTVVQKGDLLVQFDISELQKRLDLAEDRLISALAKNKNCWLNRMHNINNFKEICLQPSFHEISPNCKKS
jgi:HlyD family secretion protein